LTTVTDRRIQKTRTLLREALVSLIREKNYDSIAVKEILDRANVGRSTFYMHCRDKTNCWSVASSDLLVQYVASTFILVLNWWLESRSLLAPKEVNDLFRSLIRPALPAE